MFGPSIPQYTHSLNNDWFEHQCLLYPTVRHSSYQNAAPQPLALGDTSGLLVPLQPPGEVEPRGAFGSSHGCDLESRDFVVLLNSCQFVLKNQLYFESCFSPAECATKEKALLLRRVILCIQALEQHRDRWSHRRDRWSHNHAHQKSKPLRPQNRALHESSHKKSKALRYRQGQCLRWLQQSNKL